MAKSTLTRYRKRSYRPHIFLGILGLLILSYFAFHALNGQYGLVGRERYERQANELQEELNQLIEQRQNLEEKVSLLRSESLDLDMVDEQARETLNVIHPNEFVILRDPVNE